MTGYLHASLYVVGKRSHHANNRMATGIAVLTLLVFFWESRGARTVSSWPRLVRRVAAWPSLTSGLDPVGSRVGCPTGFASVFPVRLLADSLVSASTSSRSMSSSDRSASALAIPTVEDGCWEWPGRGEDVPEGMIKK